MRKYRVTIEFEAKTQREAEEIYDFMRESFCNQSEVIEKAAVLEELEQQSVALKIFARQF